MSVSNFKGYKKAENGYLFTQINKPKPPNPLFQ